MKLTSRLFIHTRTTISQTTKTGTTSTLKSRRHLVWAKTRFVSPLAQLQRTSSLQLIVFRLGPPNGLQQLVTFSNLAQRWLSLVPYNPTVNSFITSWTLMQLCQIVNFYKFLNLTTLNFLVSEEAKHINSAVRRHRPGKTNKFLSLRVLPRNVKLL